MNQPLMSVGQLLSSSYNDAKKHMKAFNKITILLWALMTAYQVVLFLMFGNLAQGQAQYLAPEKLSGFLTWTFVLMLIVLIPSVWLSIRLIRMSLWLDKGQTPSANESKEAWKFFLPSLWIGIISYLAVMVGMVLLIIPGIWLAIAISFAAYYLYEDNIRGVAALKASMALVKGRWWSVFWRFFATSFVIGLGYMIIIGIITWILTLIRMPMIITNAAIYALIYILLMPMVMMLYAKLFHNLKQTQAPAVSAPPAI